MPDSSNNVASDPGIVRIAALVDAFDQEMAQELLSCFLTDTQDAITDMQAALAARNGEQLRSKAHMLTGCCRSVQACITEKLSKELELMAKSEDWEKAAEQLRLVSQAYDQLVPVVKKFVECGQLP